MKTLEEYEKELTEESPGQYSPHVIMLTAMQCMFNAQAKQIQELTDKLEFVMENVRTDSPWYGTPPLLKELYNNE